MGRTKRVEVEEAGMPVIDTEVVEQPVLTPQRQEVSEPVNCLRNERIIVRFIYPQGKK